MRKLILAVALLAALILPVSVRAQSTLILPKVTIQLWPEYDQPSVLAIVDFALPSDSTFPVNVSLRIPANATLSAVAKDENGLITVPYEASNPAGDWRTVSLAVDGPENYRLEYYYAFAKAGTTRSFSFTWPGDYAVGTLAFELQEPTETKNLSTNPAMSDAFPGTNGMIYHELIANDLAAGTVYTLNIQYDRSTDAMSASNLVVEPSGGSVVPSQQSLSLTTLLPYVLGGLGLLLIVGGGLWYWQSGRSSGPRPRRRHSSQSSLDDEHDNAAIYCHQCGKRANASDRFCRACGTRLRREE